MLLKADYKFNQFLSKFQWHSSQMQKNITKEVKDQYIENYKTPVKEIEDTNKWKGVGMFMNWKGYYY